MAENECDSDSAESFSGDVASVFDYQEDTSDQESSSQESEWNMKCY